MFPLYSHSLRAGCSWVLVYSAIRRLVCYLCGGVFDALVPRRLGGSLPVRYPCARCIMIGWNPRF